jgi:hypothetical protein
MIWLAVAAGCVGCYLAKLVGYLLPSSMLDRADVRRITGLLPVALLAALVAVQTLAVGQTLVIDARLAGLAAAVVALLAKAPFLVVVLAAAVTAALLRATGVAA